MLPKMSLLFLGFENFVKSLTIDHSYYGKRIATNHISDEIAKHTQM